jgi:adenylate cyclase
MAFHVNGELVPVGGGDNIPLIRETLTIGRRESCDICMRFPNISGLHCELSFRNGYWYIRDCNSTNGIKVNNARVQEKMLHPRDEISIGKRRYTIQYELPVDSLAVPIEDVEEDILSTSLLERAGLEKPSRERKPREQTRPTPPSATRPASRAVQSFDPIKYLLEDD